MNELPRRVARAAGRVAGELHTFSDAVLAAKIVCWALVLPALKHSIPVRSLATRMHRRPTTPRRDPALERRIVTLARWGARLVRWKAGGNCLERGLITYRYLGAAGASPTLVVGIGRADQHTVIGHAWVLVDGRPVGESESSLAIYTPALAFAPDGALIDSPAESGAPAY